MSGHFDLLCPVCKTRVGGCRCPSPTKEQRLDATPCAACAADRAETIENVQRHITVFVAWLETPAGQAWFQAAFENKTVNRPFDMTPWHTDRTSPGEP